MGQVESRMWPGETRATRLGDWVATFDLTLRLPPALRRRSAHQTGAYRGYGKAAQHFGRMAARVAAGLVEHVEARRNGEILQTVREPVRIDPHFLKQVRNRATTEAQPLRGGHRRLRRVRMELIGRVHVVNHSTPPLNVIYIARRVPRRPRAVCGQRRAGQAVHELDPALSVPVARAR